MSSQVLEKIKVGEDLIMEELLVRGYEKVVRARNSKTGLDAIISIHNTALGPSLGGVRIYPYKNMKSALTDVLRLSKGMTYKSAIASVGFGGGKSVIIAAPEQKTEELLLSFGEAVEALGGNYIAAEDVGCTTKDVTIIRKKTKNVVGLPHEKSSGDPSKFTAWGTYRGIQAGLKKVFDSTSVKGRKIALQGVGAVGENLLDTLFWHGAELTIADINQEKLAKLAKKYSLKVVDSSEIHKQQCDVFAPCAMGGVINDYTVNEINAPIIAGCANNQLLDEKHGDLLSNRKILYVPDFVLNAGGLINVAQETKEEGYCPKKSLNNIDEIFNTLMTIFDIAEKNNISTGKAALELAEYRIKYKVGSRAGKPVYFHHTK